MPEVQYKIQITEEEFLEDLKQTGAVARYFDRKLHTVSEETMQRRMVV